MKTLYQLFHILKFQILIYPFRFIGILHLLFFFGMMKFLSFRYNGLPWESQPDAFFMLLPYLLSMAVLVLGVFSGYSRFASAAGSSAMNLGSSFSLWPSYSFFWTRALDRKLILLSNIVLYAVFVIMILLPGIAQLGQSLEPLQIRFQSPEDNGAFQRALLADPHLGAHQFYDYAKRIIVEIPHGKGYQIGLWLFQNLFLSLLFLWIFEGLNLTERWRNMLLMATPLVSFIGLNLPWYGWLLVLFLLLVFLVYVDKFIPRPRPLRLWLSPQVLPVIIPIMVSILGALKFFPSFNRFLERTLPPDPTFYGNRFMLYANYHLWLWIGLTLAAIFLIQSIIRKHLRPA